MRAATTPSAPKKSRPSDIYRKAPEYPAMPDIPWYTKIDSLSKPASQPIAAE